MATAFVPTTDAEAFEHYFAHVKWLVSRTNIRPDRVEDFAMDLMEKFIAKGLLKQYDPAKGANFKTFLSGFVTSYLLGFGDKDRTDAGRSMYSTDIMVGENKDTPILDIMGINTEDMTSDVDAEVLLTEVRNKLPENRKLFFDMLILQVNEHGVRDVAELAEMFGVSKWSIHLWLRSLREVFAECL